MTASSDTVSLCPSFQADAPAAWWHGREVSHRRLMAHAFWLAQRLPERAHAILLCEDRFHFLVAFAAALSRRQTCLLPANRLAGEIAGVARDYPESYCIVDEKIAGLALEQVVCELPRAAPEAEAWPPRIPAAHVAAITFTSGTTGRPNPNRKTWGSLVAGAELWRRAFWGQDARRLSLAATVPPQHMYGLETTILLALAGGVAVDGGKPFFPKTIREVLRALPAPRALVTTPIHLRACAEAKLDWPEVELIISATAPLHPPLARRVEEVFQTQVREIYGCTEAGSLAHRRTLDGDGWRVYDGISLHGEGEAVIASGGHLPAPVRLQDAIRLDSETAFRLAGRTSDMVNVAGKRGSLAGLNRKLKAIPGVADGVFFLPDEDGGGINRLAALAVAPGLKAPQILAQLRKLMDPAFLPRPLLLVPSLPYSELGKLPRARLLAEIRRHKGKGKAK